MTGLDMNGAQAAQMVVLAAASFVGLRFVPAGWRQRLGIALLIAYVTPAASLTAWFTLH